ncbi:MAG: hypothetical protein LBQ80_04210 [Clostridium sp.]|jgi:hypothetical protein|nr:hypothetical protein [Clostridium sp.]
MTIANILATLYTDRMTVQRAAEDIDENVTQNDLQAVASLTDVPCRISYKTIDVPIETETGEQIQRQVQVFCSPDFDLRAGDFLTLTRRIGDEERQTITGYAGAPAHYSGHAELIVEQAKWA